MRSYYSVLKYVSNPLSDESISLGLLMVSQNNAFYKKSEKKLELLKKLNSRAYKLVDFSLKQFDKFIGYENSIKESFIASNNNIDSEYISKLSSYNKGLLQFSKPSPIESEITEEVFEKYFRSYIDVEEQHKKLKQPDSEFFVKVKNQLYSPLINQVDVDYTLEKNRIETLYFDFHFDALGVNGALYSAKVIDFNNEKSAQDIRHKISDYESVIERLKSFAYRKDINGDHNFYLISDPFKGSKPSYNDLYSIISQTNMPFFKLATSDEIGSFVSQIKNNNAHKFSEELEKLGNTVEE